MYTHIPKVDAKYLRQLNQKLPKVIHNQTNCKFLLSLSLWVTGKAKQGYNLKLKNKTKTMVALD